MVNTFYIAPLTSLAIMPPKLRKDEPTTGSKSTPKGSDRFGTLAEDLDNPNTIPPPSEDKSNHSQLKSVTEAQIVSIKGEIKYMHKIIKILNLIYSKIDKLYRIDQIKSCQNSNNVTFYNMLNYLHQQIAEINTVQNDDNIPTTPSYASILTTSKKKHKNDKNNNYLATIEEANESTSSDGSTQCNNTHTSPNHTPNQTPHSHKPETYDPSDHQLHDDISLPSLPASQISHQTWTQAYMQGPTMTSNSNKYEPDIFTYTIYDQAGYGNPPQDTFHEPKLL